MSWRGTPSAINARGEYDGLVYLPATAENNFTPDLPTRKVDVIYLCYPNNPTGATATKATLTRWVDYARANEALLLFDAAYEAYITDPSIPHSIYEIPGARDVAIEFRSYSKTAGFTGTRCAFTVVPKTVLGKTSGGSTGEKVDFHRLWSRRQTTKFNGVSYVVQRAAEAVYSPEGKKQVKSTIDFYMANAKIIRETLSSLGMHVYGGVNAPYIWLKTPGDMTSWDFFDKLLSEANVVGTPGSGFGAAGEGYFRISAFNSRANVEEAMTRMKSRLRILTRRGNRARVVEHADGGQEQVRDDASRFGGCRRRSPPSPPAPRTTRLGPARVARRPGADDPADGAGGHYRCADCRERLRALRHPDYRMLWIGAAVSNVGSWIETVARQWLVYELGGSKKWLGIDAFVSGVATIVFLPLGGVLADHLDRRWLLASGNIVLGVLSVVFAVLYAKGICWRRAPDRRLGHHGHLHGDSCARQPIAAAAAWCRARTWAARWRSTRCSSISRGRSGPAIGGATLVA